MVKFVTFDEKQYPIRVGYYALSMLKEKTGKALSSITEEEFEAYEILFFYALEAGHQITKQRFEFKMEEMKFKLDQCFFEFIELIPTFFPQTTNPAPPAGKK